MINKLVIKHIFFSSMLKRALQSTKYAACYLKVLKLCAQTTKQGISLLTFALKHILPPFQFVGHFSISRFTNFVMHLDIYVCLDIYY
jgi:hypothetical protein